MAPTRHRVRQVATGPVALGNAASARRLNHIVIGDTENLATRPHVEHKARGTTIPVTECTAGAAGLDGFDLAGPVTARGRHVEAFVCTPKQPSS